MQASIYRRFAKMGVCENRNEAKTNALLPGGEYSIAPVAVDHDEDNNQFILPAG